MESTREHILDAAERRIRLAGYQGFSFREIAADVGVKSASVHHHFATKEQLGAAVARRYTERFYAALENRRGEPMLRLRDAFSQAMQTDGLVCLCGVLGAEASALPAMVSVEARLFFERGIQFLLQPQATQTSGPQRSWALRILALLEGAMILSRALGDPSSFFEATRDLPEKPAASVPSSA